MKTNRGPVLQSELLQQHLRDRDESCPRCGYNLRGASSNQCPECGEKLELCIAREKPLSRASNVIVLILSGASGLGLMYAGAWVWGWAIGKRTIFLRAEYDWHIWLPVIFFIAPATVVTFLLRR